MATKQAKDLQIGEKVIVKEVWSSVDRIYYSGPCRVNSVFNTTDGEGVECTSVYLTHLETLKVFAHPFRRIDELEVIAG